MLNKRFLTAKQLAEYLGTTEGSIRAQQCKGNIPSKWVVRMGRSVRFDLTEVDKSIDEAKENKNGNIFEAHA